MERGGQRTGFGTNLKQLSLLRRAENLPTETPLPAPHRIKAGATAGIVLAAVAVLLGIVAFFIVLHCLARRRTIRDSEEHAEERPTRSIPFGAFTLFYMIHSTF